MSLAPAILERFSAWLLANSWQAVVVAGLVLIVQYLLGGWLTARARHALWWLVVLRLMLPVPPASSLSLFNFLSFDAAVGAVPWREKSSRMTAPMVEPVDHLLPRPAERRAPDTVPFPAATIDSRAVPNRWILDAKTKAPGDQPARPGRQIDLWSLVWLVGAMFFTVRVAWAAWRLRRYVRRLPAVTDRALLKLLAGCQNTLGMPSSRVTLVETPDLVSPALAGVLHPKLIVPRRLLNGLSSAELRFVLLHELGHLKRRDLAVNWLLTVLEVMHWFNPFVWLAFSRMRADRELACDALVLEHAGSRAPQAYGGTLIKLMEMLAPRVGLSGAAGILAGKQSLKRRILMVANFRPSSLGAQLAAVTLIIVLAAISLTRPVHSDEVQLRSKRKAAADANLPAPAKTAASERSGDALQQPDTEDAAQPKHNLDDITPEDVPLPTSRLDAKSADVPSKSEATGELAASTPSYDPYATSALRDLERRQAVIRADWNRLVAARKQVESVETLYETNVVTLDLLLDAQRRAVDAEVAYISTVKEFGKAAAAIDHDVTHWMRDRVQSEFPGASDKVSIAPIGSDDDGMQEPAPADVVPRGGRSKNRRPAIHRLDSNAVEDYSAAKCEQLLRLRAVLQGRDAALKTWREVYRLLEAGARGGSAADEAQAREQYFLFRNQAEAALEELDKLD